MARNLWTLEEARRVLPRVIEATVRACEEAAEVVGELEAGILPENLQEEKEDRLGEIVSRWTEAIIRMGADVKGLWLVDFDHGSGYYCWKLGESDIIYEHSYEAGFAGRRRIDEAGDPAAG
ncbi:MAG: DUF2203 domain-containing protein [bacterium]|nr:DUF2203 domain-containing protein [bacterium]